MALIFSAGMIHLHQVLLTSRRNYKASGFIRVSSAMIQAFGPLAFLSAGVSGIEAFAYSIIVSGLVVLPTIRVVKPAELLAAIRFVRMRGGVPAQLVPQALLSGISIQLPVYFMASRFPETLTAAFFFASRIFSLPMSLVGAPAGQYFSSIMYQRRTGSIWRGYWLYSMVVGAASLTLLAFSFLDLRMVLGEFWKHVSGVLAFGAIVVFFQAVNIPLATMLSISDWRKWGLYLLLFFLPVRWLLMESAGDSWSYFLFSYALGAVLFYLSYSVLSAILINRELTRCEQS